MRLWLCDFSRFFIDIDAEDVVDFFAARVTSRNVASRTKKKVEEKKGWIGFVFVIPVYLNLVRIS